MTRTITISQTYKNNQIAMPFKIYLNTCMQKFTNLNDIILASRPPSLYILFKLELTISAIILTIQQFMQLKYLHKIHNFLMLDLFGERMNLKACPLVMNRLAANEKKSSNDKEENPCTMLKQVFRSVNNRRCSTKSMFSFSSLSP